MTPTEASQSEGAAVEPVPAEEDSTEVAQTESTTPIEESTSAMEGSGEDSATEEAHSTDVTVTETVPAEENSTQGSTTEAAVPSETVTHCTPTEIEPTTDKPKNPVIEMNKPIINFLQFIAQHFGNNYVGYPGPHYPGMNGSPKPEGFFVYPTSNFGKEPNGKPMPPLVRLIAEIIRQLNQHQSWAMHNDYPVPHKVPMASPDMGDTEKVVNFNYINTFNN